MVKESATAACLFLYDETSLTGIFLSLMQRSSLPFVFQLLTAVALFGVSIATCQDLSPEQSAQMNKLLNLQKKLENGAANSSGVHLQAKEVARVNNGGLVVSYELYADGFTSDRFDLVAIPIGPEPEPVSAGSDLMLAKDGKVLDGPNDPRTLIFPNFVPGEPSRLGLLSKDGKERAFVNIVPNPIKSTDHGCSLSVVRVLPRFELAFVEGTGFPPNADVDFEVNSLGEVHTGKLKSDSTGYLSTAVLPFVKDKPKGELKLVVTAPQCKPKASFHWGTTSE